MKKKHKIEFFDIVVYFIVTLAVIATLYPFINVLAVSLSPYSEYIKNPMMIIPKNLNFDAFDYILSNPVLGRSYFNTIFIVITTVIISLAVNLMAAYPLSQDGFRGKKAIMNIIIFTMLFSGGMIPGFLVMQGIKLYDTLWALILPSCFTAYNFVLMKNYVESLPHSLIEAARLDGASEFRILCMIVAPLSAPIVATIAMFVAVGQWNSFFNAIIYTRSQSNWTVQLFLRELIMQSSVTTVFDAAEAEKNIMPETIKYAAIIVVMLPIMCVYPFIQKYFMKGVMVGAVKG